MILSKKVRLRPTKAQEQQFWKSAGTARYVYNWTLNQQQENYKLGNKFIQDNELRKVLTQLKKEELSWLNEISCNVPKQAVKDACNAYKSFFNHTSSFPKFKSKKRSKPSFYHDTHTLKVKEDKVLIEKAGWVKIKRNSLPVNAKYSNPRVTFDGKYWYLSVGIEQDFPKMVLTKNTAESPSL